MELTLFSYWRSSSSWRVRWALALKKLEYAQVAVDLRTGAQRATEYLAVNPMGAVPCLLVDGQALGESVAIIEWLEERFPMPALLPGDALARARIREMVQVVNADTQPLQNLLALQEHARGDAAEAKRWAQLWIRRGLAAFEKLSARFGVPYAAGDWVTMADLYLVPQCYNAERQGIDLAAEFPRLRAVRDACMATPEAQASRPEAQPDAPG